MAECTYIGFGRPLPGTLTDVEPMQTGILKNEQGQGRRPNQAESHISVTAVTITRPKLVF